MTLEGIDPASSGKKYCVHNPIRAKVTATHPNCKYLEVSFTAGIETYTTRFYPTHNNAEFELELQEWFKVFFRPANNPLTYTVTEQDVPSHNYKIVEVLFSEYYYNNDNTEVTEVINTPLTVAVLNAQNNQAQNFYLSRRGTPQFKLRYWAGYPFSIFEDDDYLRYQTRIAQPGSFPLSVPYQYADQARHATTGVYVRWLAPDTGYHYWLFPYIEEDHATKELGTMNRWFLNEEQETGNEDSLGLSLTQGFTLADKIPQPYWELLNTIFTSPQIYLLTQPPNLKEYTPAHWQRVHIKAQNYQNKSYQNAQEYSIKFVYPKSYTQVV